MVGLSFGSIYKNDISVSNWKSILHTYGVAIDVGLFVDDVVGNFMCAMVGSCVGSYVGVNVGLFVVLM